MKIVAFAASTSSTSINKQLATYAAQQVEGAEITVLDINNYNVPMYSEDKEKEIGQAEGAQAFLRDLSQADAIVVSYAEHNGYYPAAYKNLFDWATRIDRSVFQNKPVVYLATSPGAGGAQSVLAAAIGSAPYFGAQVKASLSVPNFYDNFDVSTGEFKSAEWAEKVKQAVQALR
ncbi:NADPH-dependent FMN reductase [Vibrio cidicii]|uniref:NADPH-dependent FMN reductase n=1 Tax=Vibrio cidicii TaxID=1763883 RepID=A0A151JGX7_9VIBR|nr:NAD(P)H-dependent oxidoreductase [Vibrio cidicii]KYN25039.1 NADPH-dependent FMN reductase [Vibrio cidicii]MBG0755789.1 NADPH-dependent FMN reductase [Vibrio cidicii]